MKKLLVDMWCRARAYAAVFAFLAFGSSTLLAQEQSNAYAPDFTEATTAITAIATGITDWIKNTVMGKIISVVIVFVVLRLAIWAIKYFGRGGSR